MKTIQEIVNNKMESMIVDGTIEKALEDGVAKAVQTAIDDQFKSYGDLTKQIEKAMSEGLQIDTKDLPFETYNQQMLVVIKQKLGSLFAGAASERFLDEIDSLLAPVQKEMSVKDFVETIAAMWKTDDPWGADDLDDYATAELEQCDWGNDNYRLKMWKKKESVSSYSTRDIDPEFDLFLSDGKIRINHKHRYNTTCFDSVDALIFKLYAAGTVLTGVDEFDPDECELTLKEEY